MKLDLLFILSKILSGGNNPASLKDAIMDKAAKDSKIAVTSIVFGGIGLFLISTAIALGVYYILATTTMLTINEKIGFTVLSLLVVSGIIFGIIYLTISKKVEEYQDIKDSRPDFITPVTQMIQPFVNQLKAEHELMTSNKVHHYKNKVDEKFLH